MALCLELDIMIDRVISWTLLCFVLFLLDAGHCFRYDRDIERTLCRTQCAALCFDDKQSCARTCNNSMVYRFWMTNCDEPYSICIGTCQVLTPSSRTISNIFHTDYIYDDSVRYPPIPKLHIAAVEGDTILLTWDLPNDAYKVYHVIEMRYEDKEWNVLKEQIEDNQLNVTVPDICLYEFRIMAINQYGSNGFSAPLGVKSIPLEPIRNVSFVGNGLYYHEPTGEFMAIISWDEISSLDEHVVSHYSWNEMSYVNCPRPSQNMQPTFYKFNSKHGRKFILMRVSRDAYGCVFTTQIKAKSVCGEVGGWTNFTIDLSDCNKINNFPCSSVDPNFSDPGNVENVTIHVDKGQDPPLIRLSWFPPRDLGTAGKIDHYDIRWGKVYQKEPAFFLNQPDFVSVPNITHLSSVVREFAVSVTFQDLISSKYGFQIIPIAPSRHLGDAEYGLFEIYMIQSSRVGLVGNHSIHGTILLDGDEVKIVQVPNSLDVEVAWHLQQQGRRSINSSNEKLFFKNYAVKVGKLVKQDTGQHMVNGSVTLVDSTSQ